VQKEAFLVEHMVILVLVGLVVWQRYERTPYSQKTSKYARFPLRSVAGTSPQGVR
jgi:hypothetical protein